MANRRDWGIQKIHKTGTIGDIKVEIEFSPTKTITALNKAQYALDSTFLNYMIQYMPMDTGALINEVRARSAAVAGKGEVYVATPPYGVFQWNGVVMVDPQTNSPWARKGAKKVVTSKPLKYSNPRAVAHWDQETIQRHGQQIIEAAKKAFSQSKK